ncbi:hypothetical protein CBOM_05280 [Ceraceosorus bombacis]|uniref:Uncharacterized protein n=1 Tax=Ceraceosorus bombacis TaxID=401625 RepID=A0A0P1BNR1_9BASI|nr:hypothetical protein CBOM_05280 [Ceraceosorus bombacis]
MEGQERFFRRAETSQAQSIPETLGKRQGEASEEDLTSEQRAAMEGLVQGLQGSIIGDSSQGLDALRDPNAVFNGVRPLTNYGDGAASAPTGALAQAFPGLSASQLSGVANALQQSLGTSPLGGISSGVTGQSPPALSGLGNGADTAQNQAANIAAQLASLLSGVAQQASWPLSNTLQQGYSPLANALGGVQGASGGLSSLTNALPGLAQSVPVSSTINPQLSSLVGSLPQQAAQIQQAAQLSSLQALLGSSNALGRAAPVQQAPQLSPAELSKLQSILGSASAGQASLLGAKLSAQDFSALPASLDPSALSALLGSASVGGLTGGANAGLPTALSGILGAAAAPSSILGSLTGGLPLTSGLLGSGSLPATLPSSLENLLPTQSVAPKTPGLASLTPEVIQALQSALQGAATTGASGPNWTPADAAAAAAQSVANAEAQAEDGEPPLIDAADLAAANANPGLLSPAQLQTLKEQQPVSSNTTQNVQNATGTPTESAGAPSKTADSAYQFAAKSLPLPGLASELPSGLSLDPATIAALASKGVDVGQLGQLTQLGLPLDASTIRALASKGINVGSLTSLLTPSAVTGPLSNAQDTLNGLPLVGGQLSGVLNQGQGAVAGASGLLSGLTGSQASGLLSGILGKLPLNLKDQQAKEGNLTEAAGSQMAFGASTASEPTVYARAAPSARNPDLLG